MDEERALDQLLIELEERGLTREEILRWVAGAVAAAGILPYASDVAEAAVAAESAKRGGNLRVGAGEDAYRVTGPRAAIGQYPLNANICETLARMTANYSIEPGLATSWRSRGSNTWRLELRRGVRFHDGRPFTAEAVKWTFDRIAKAGGGTPGFGPDSTKVVGRYTVDVTPVFDNQRFIEQVVHPSYSIIAPGTIPETGGRPVGTGPFSFASYDPQREFVVRRFDRYWGTKAMLDQITWRFLPDPNARRLALQAGDVDLILDVPREAVSDLRGRGFVVKTSQVGAYEALYLKIGEKAGGSLLRGNPAIRKAIGYAIDRNALVGGVLENLAKNEQTMVPARLLGPRSSQIEGYKLDRARAARLLDQAGWVVGQDGVRAKGGQRLKLQLINGFPNALVHGAVPEFLQDQLRRIGIEIEIVKVPDTAAYEDRLAEGKGDLWLEQGSQNDANPLFLPALLFWSRPDFGDPGYQAMFAPGGRFDTLIAQALKAKTFNGVRSTTSDALRFLIDRNAIVIPLAGIYRIAVMNKKVQGFQTHPSGLQVQYRQVSLG